MIDSLLRVLFVITPMYFANASALFFGGKRQLDLGKKFFDENPVFGSGKTFEGTIGGLLAGMAATLGVQLVFWEQTKIVSEQYLLLGLLLSIGAIIGDIAASFLKRRMGKRKGYPMPLLDQLDFVAGALVFAMPLFVPKTEELAAIIILTLVVHSLSNRFAFALKLKNVPW